VRLPDGVPSRAVRGAVCTETVCGTLRAEAVRQAVRGPVRPEAVREALRGPVRTQAVRGSVPPEAVCEALRGAVPAQAVREALLDPRELPELRQARAVREARGRAVREARACTVRAAHAGGGARERKGLRPVRSSAARARVGPADGPRGEDVHALDPAGDARRDPHRRRRVPHADRP
jgi:hypothetical protein